MRTFWSSPRSTLFPYTTLFRSVRTERDVSVHPSTRLPGTTEIEREIRRRLESEQEFAVCYADLDQDRKSTRLNSSHLVISYAVFCLKKKTEVLVVAQDTAGNAC